MAGATERAPLGPLGAPLETAASPADLTARAQARGQARSQVFRPRRIHDLCLARADRYVHNLMRMEVPEHYRHAVIPHIMIDGAAEAIEFYKTAFGHRSTSDSRVMTGESCTPKSASRGQP
jgi:hypothetical protein